MPNPKELLRKAIMAIPANQYKRGPVTVSKEPLLAVSVSQKKSSSGRTPCMEEMSVLMTCWNKYDYKDVDCMAEVTAFQKCSAQALKDKKTMMDLMKRGVTMSGKLTSKQANILLKRYPQPKVITESIA